MTPRSLHGPHPDFRERLREELARRRRINRRYSLRAFADHLAIDHSTLSQMLRGRRRLSPGVLRRWAALLGLGSEETEIYAAAATAEDPAALDARVLRMHWLGEAALILDQQAHWRLLELLRAPDWRPDMHWAAERTGVGIDELNDALARLLRLGLLRIDTDGTWRDATGLVAPTERAMKELALEKMRRAQAADL